MKFSYSLLIILISLGRIVAQETLTSAHLEPNTFRFTLGPDNKITGEAKEQLLELIGQNQFVGIAEVHQSQQLSFFTTGLVELLKERGFDHLALEIGPYSANMLQSITLQSGAQRGIKELNRKYGKNAFAKVPIMFADKVEDAMFIDRASQLGYQFWGLDQEFGHSYEMLVDLIYDQAISPDSELKALYAECKKLIRKNISKNKVSGMGKNCWLLQHSSIDNFFRKFEGNVKATRIIRELKSSWDIYCRYENGQPSNQIRANYMKRNFDSLYSVANKKETAKVLVKLGGVHLTHGLSPFKVDDVGKYLHEKSLENGTGFLSIRHLVAYKNGKSNIGKSGWKGVTMFLELGRMDEWTIIDLRPFREKVRSGELVTNDKYEFELTSYDLLLIPPNDKTAQINY